jgi:hypothetical protein
MGLGKADARLGRGASRDVERSFRRYLTRYKASGLNSSIIATQGRADYAAIRGSSSVYRRPSWFPRLPSVEHTRSGVNGGRWRG